MLATLGKPPTGDQWATEWKFDGQRGLIVVDDGVTVFSRSGADVTRTFPEVAAHISEAVGRRRLVLDGEIVALDGQGRPCFQRLQQRWPQQRRPSADLLHRVPVRFCPFDILSLDGADVTTRPYAERRELLETAMAGAPKVPPVPRFSVSDASPSEMLAVAAEHDMEGIVVKRLDSHYRAGRSNAWIKCPVRNSADVVIAGWWPASGPGGTQAVGALLLAGHNNEGQLVAVGDVGTGFSATARRRMFEMLVRVERKTAPILGPANRLPGVRWARPKYVGEVAFREYVPGQGLRHTSSKGLREVDAASVKLPSLR